jgi:lysosomal Pro-X carboxypeptidase
LLPQFDWVGNTFGGKFNYQQEYRQYTKIIFSNGGIDPWKAGGVTEYVSPENPVFVMPSGAHHLDLRMPNIDDPEDVNFVREQEMAIIGDWVIDYQGNFDILSGAKFMQK